MKSILLLFAIASLGCLSSCMMMGTALKEKEVQSIKVGVTTRADLVSSFGAPEHDANKQHMFVSSQERSHGKPDLHWAHMTWVVTSFDFEALEVWLDAQGKVKEYWFTTGDLSMRSGPKLDESKVKQIKKGVTTREGVQKLFGEPPLAVHTSSRLLSHGWFYYTKEGYGDTETLLTVVYDARGRVSRVDVEHDPDLSPQ